MSTYQHRYGVRLADGVVVDMPDRRHAKDIAARLGAEAVWQTESVTPWESLSDPPFPGRRTASHDPQPDRYQPGSQFPDRGSIAGFSGIDNNTRRIVGAVLHELALDVSELTDPDTILDVVVARAFTIGAPHS